MFIVMRCTQCNEHWAAPTQADISDEKKAFDELASSGKAKCPKCGSTQVAPIHF